MKVLLVHNFYGSSAPSGENIVFENERQLLESKGVTVSLHTRSSDAIRKMGIVGKVMGGLAVPYNFNSILSIRKVVAQFEPDIVHVHNTFPLISPSILGAIADRVPVVCTLHNFRMFCSAGVPIRDGAICTDCLQQRSVLPALRHGCYRDSRIATAPLAAGIALHRWLGTWDNHVHRYIALTSFQRTQMTSAGLSPDLISVKPNFSFPAPAHIPWVMRKDCVVFVGRLSPEKGLFTLITAWRLLSSGGSSVPDLHIIGDGPLRSDLEKMAEGLPVHFMGRLSQHETRDQISQSKLLILPSECYEGFPMVVLEAFATGTPCAVSHFGPLPSLIQDERNGVVFVGGDPMSLMRSILKCWKSPRYLERLGTGAFRSFKAKYGPDANFALLLQIYEEARIEWRRRMKGGQ